MTVWGRISLHRSMAWHNRQIKKINRKIYYPNIKESKRYLDIAEILVVKCCKM